MKQIVACPQCLLLALCVLSARNLSAETGIKVGVGTVEITPKKNLWLAGYAARTKPSDGTIHPLMAKALVIEDKSGAETILLTTDLLGLPAEVAHKSAEMARVKFNIPRERLMLTSSHTHCGPVLSGAMTMYGLDDTQTALIEEYTAGLPELLNRAIGDAILDLEPCSLSWGIGSADFAVNRRQYTLQAVVIGVNPIGPVDHDVPVLKAARKDGTTKAVLFGYACHNTTLDIQQWCGDYAGFAQIELESQIPGAKALFVAGCAGDQNPEPRRILELAQKYGKALARSVMDVCKGSMREVKGPIRAEFREIPLALTDPPSKDQIQKQMEDKNVYIQRRSKKLMKTLEDKGSLEKNYPYPIQVWRFGEGMEIIALGGEAVVDYSLRIKHEFGRDHVWPIAYANDVCAYIPSLRVLREGGYEGGESMVYYGLHGPWEPTIEETIMAAIRGMVGN